MVNQKKTPMKDLSSHVFYETAYKLLTSPYPPAEFISALTMPEKKNQDPKLRNEQRNFFHFCAMNFPICLSLKLMQAYTSRKPRLTDEIRENAMKILSAVLLSKEREEISLEFAVVQELSPMVISCLEEQAISDSSLEILSNLVKKIAVVLFNEYETNWNELLEFMSSRAETEFEKSVFLFRSLTMPLDDDEFVIPLMDYLLPAILKRLSNEREWMSAFIGGFCAAIRLLESELDVLLENLANQMLESVSIGMKLGLLEKALRKMEIIVKKQLHWYGTTESRFILGLIRRIDAISEEETKIVLQRIKIAVKNKIVNCYGKIYNEDDDDEEYWLNQG